MFVLKHPKTSTVLGLVLVLSIFLRAVIVLDFQSTWTWQVLSQVFSFMFVCFSRIGKNDSVFTVIFISHKAS